MWVRIKALPADNPLDCAIRADESKRLADRKAEMVDEALARFGR